MAIAYNPSIRNRILGLDELRGIAVLFVVIDHGYLIFSKEIPSFLYIIGSIGVDLFFIISGYLITHILINSVSDKNYFRKFYIRRIFRIWPLYFLVVSVSILAGIYKDGVLATLKSIPIYLTFTQNFITPLRIGEVLPGLGHLWSLAVEEQFYLVLPLLLYFLPKKQWIYAFVILCGLSIVGRSLFFSTENVPLDFYYTNFKQTYFRLHILCIGVLIALPYSKKTLAILFSIWLLSLILFFKGNGLLEMPVNLLIAIIIYRTVAIGPIFTSKFLSHIGKLCFGIYVLHFPIARALGAVLKNEPLPVKFIFYVGYLFISYLIAVASLKYFEIPIQNHRGKYEQ